MNDAMLKEALMSTFDIRYEKYNIDELPEYEFSKKFEKRMKKLISRQKKPYFVLVATKTRRIACVIVAVFISLTLTSFSVEAVREQFIQFFINIFTDHTEININKEDITISNFNIDNIDENIPSYFVLVDSSNSVKLKLRDYRCGEQYIILTVTYNEDSAIFIDNENSEYDIYYDESGQEYMVCESVEHNQVIILWLDGSNLNKIVSNIEKEEIYNLIK